MKYLRGRDVLPSGANKENWLECSVCNNKDTSMWVTVEKKNVCFDCQSSDEEAEFVNRER